MASGSESLRLGERHSGFNVYCSPRIQPGDEQAIEENIARYIIRASFSQEGMTPYHVRGRLYIPEESKVNYQSKACPRPRSGNGKEEKVFDALEWPALLTIVMLIVR